MADPGPTDAQITANDCANVLEPVEHEGDELVEITPKSIRLRKRLLRETDRKRADRRERGRAAGRLIS